MAPQIFTRLRSLFGWETNKRPMFKSRLRDIAQNEAQSTANAANAYHNEMDFALQNRTDRYDVYDSMDQMSDVASILDAYAEDATQKDQRTEKTVWVEGSNKKVVDSITDMFERLQTEDFIEGVCRDTGKNGDDLAVINADRVTGIKSLLWRDPRDIDRIENKEGILVGFEETTKIGQYRQKVTGELQNGKDGSAIKMTYYPWDVVHFRIYKRKRLSREKIRNIYGTSLLAGSERISKQVKILDDMLMIMRLTRSLDHKTYFVDVGKSPVEEEVYILKKWQRALKRKTYADPSSGRFDSRFDPFAWTEDIFWPIKENKNSRVEVTQGITDVSDIVDIDHFRDKFYGSMRAPKAYFGYDGDWNSKATLSSQSLKWARAVYSLQRAIVNGLTRLAQIHLAYVGLPTDKKNFKVMMTAPSIVELLDKLEAWGQVVDVAERMSGLGVELNIDKKEWTKYILSEIMWFSKEEAKRFSKNIEDEPQDDEQEPKEPPEPHVPYSTPITDPDAPPADAPKEPPAEGSNNHSRHRLVEIQATNELLSQIREEQRWYKND